MIRYYGDTDDTIWGRGRGGDQVFMAPADDVPVWDLENTDNLIVGDARNLFCHAQGGNDTLRGADNSEGVDTDSNRIFGDAEGTIGCFARGGNDHLAGGNGAFTAFNVNEIRGDALRMTGFAQGGNDELTGGNIAVNILIGDADFMGQSARGGDDRIVAGDDPRGENILFGDAREMNGRAQGGDDVLLGGSGWLRGSNTLYGDAETMSGDARCGDDVLVAATNTFNDMWGDARTRAAGVATGQDMFVITPGGQTQINDFETGKDRIDVTALGIQSFEELGSATDPAFGTYFLNGAIRLPGVFDVSESDIVFA